MLEPPLGGGRVPRLQTDLRQFGQDEEAELCETAARQGAGERHVQRMPEPRRRVNLPETQTAPGYIALRETADRPILQFELPGQSLALGIDLQTAIQHAVMHSQTEPRLLANGQKPNTVARLVQRVVEIPWFGHYQRPLD